MCKVVKLWSTLTVTDQETFNVTKLPSDLHPEKVPWDAVRLQSPWVEEYSAQSTYPGTQGQGLSGQPTQVHRDSPVNLPRYTGTGTVRSAYPGIQGQGQSGQPTQVHRD